MNNIEIITYLAENKKVEEIVQNISKKSFPYEDELSQDIYLSLLEKPSDLIERLYEKKELNYFIVKMVKNNLLSRNSPYYQKYMRWVERKTELTDNINITE